MTSADTSSLVIEKEFAYPPEKVWRALTEGELMREWLLENDFEPVVGHAFSFRTEAPAAAGMDWDGVIESEVLVVRPYEELAYRWNALGLVSVVRWTLAATAGGTLVRMEQSGFRPDQKAAYHGANYGWEKFLEGLERVLSGELGMGSGE